INGLVADDNTLFPEGQTRVRVSYIDHALNVGTADATITVTDREDNDIFVSAPGACSPRGCGNDSIWRVRGGAAEQFCAPEQYTPFTDSPDLIVDSAGRVVFLAYMGYFVGYPVALYRCNHFGDPPEALFEFKTSMLGPQADPDLPEAFPGTMFNALSALHLARVRSLQIHPDGTSEVITEDAYELA